MNCIVAFTLLIEVGLIDVIFSLKLDLNTTDSNAFKSERTNEYKNWLAPKLVATVSSLKYLHSTALHPGLFKEGQDANHSKWSLHFSAFMAATERGATTDEANDSTCGYFDCYGFGYNGFLQINVDKSADEVDGNCPWTAPAHVALPVPSEVLTPLTLNVGRVDDVVASWSSNIYLKGD